MYTKYIECWHVNGFLLTTHTHTHTTELLKLKAGKKPHRRILENLTHNKNN